MENDSSLLLGKITKSEFKRLVAQLGYEKPKIGKWEIDWYTDEFDNSMTQIGVYCSNCGEPQDDETNYCPECGAKMVNNND